MLLLLQCPSVCLCRSSVRSTNGCSVIHQEPTQRFMSSNS
ncbi:hypothetical protein B4109_2261 [Geobacillus stearothermophilus]|uniref:Uncharacterized protein n=1 Tax=Geobacillus stearothermophilus TaxID=1422 RepID=A0A150MFU8_GEOSE|nr:hypothetical protein B4109_2261 [Geobacillus stearothermophilus]